MPTPRRHTDNAARQADYRKRREHARREEQHQKGFPALPTIPTMPGERRWETMLAQAASLLSTVVDEREAYYDQRSEAWLESDKGDTFQERTGAIDDILDTLNDLNL